MNWASAATHPAQVVSDRSVTRSEFAGPNQGRAGPGTLQAGQDREGQACDRSSVCLPEEQVGEQGGGSLARGVWAMVWFFVSGPGAPKEEGWQGGAVIQFGAPCGRFRRQNMQLVACAWWIVG